MESKITSTVIFCIAFIFVVGGTFVLIESALLAVVCFVEALFITVLEIDLILKNRKRKRNRDAMFKKLSKSDKKLRKP